MLSDHFAKMGQKAVKTTKERQSADFYRTIGMMGAEARRRKRQQAQDA